MTLLVDTNVLLRLVSQADPLHETALGAIDTLEDRGEKLFVSAQNFVELWNVATRPPGRNGLGLTPPSADRLLRRLEPAFPRLAESEDIYQQWRKLVVRFEVSGVQVHDARLVAVMLANDIATILTFNTRDFQRYVQIGIQAVDPSIL